MAEHRLILLLILVLLGGGCTGLPLAEETLPYAPRNHAGDARLPAGLRRVVLLPIAAAGPTGAVDFERLDAQVLVALQRAQRFEVVPLGRAECRQLFGAEAFASIAALPPGLLERVGREFAADAVMFVDLTVLQPYPPPTVGIRAKLATVADVRMVWTCDEVIAADDPAVGVALRRRLHPPGAAGDAATGVRQSPVRFVGFAAEMVFATLPVR